MENNAYLRTLLASFAAAGETTACALYDGETATDISYRQLQSDILHTAGWLQDAGIRGKHVAICAPNSYAWVVMCFGVLAAGNRALLLNPALPGEMLREQCSRADAEYIWSSEALAPELASLKTLSFEDCLKGSLLALQQVYVPEGDETVLLLGTSGTTGSSKIVEITTNNLCGCLDNLAESSGKPGLERSLMGMPLFHIGGLVYGMIMLQRLKVLCFGRGLRYLFGDMPVLNPTYIALVPSMLESLEKIMRRNPEPENRAKYLGTGLQRIFVGGASSRNSSCRYLMEQGFALETGYGMTETTGDGTWCEVDQAHVGTIGKPCGNLQWRIQQGELQFKGPSIMKGYYRDPEETARLIQDGWIATGDMGYCDADGYLYLTGRKKNVIILPGGENVNPEEVESRLLEGEGILECLVYGDGRGLCAEVYTRDPEAAQKTIRSYNDAMPLFHQVYKVEYVSRPLEKTGTGKIKRKDSANV